MSDILLIDFGASRIKALLFDSYKSVIIDNEVLVSPSTKSCSSNKNAFEIPIEYYWEALLETAGKLILRNPEKEIEKMWICSEMHGFVLTDLDGTAITPYISWKDQRGNFDVLDGESTFEELRRELHSFRSITGMHLKAGIPLLSLSSGIRSGSIPELKVLGRGAKVRVLSLVDWLLFRGGESEPKVNITLAAGLGIYDINKKLQSDDILNSRYLRALNISTLGIQSDISQPLGSIHIFDSKISVFGGIGDFQAAIDGSGLFDQYDGVLNLGTGSQVAVRILENVPPSAHEIRIATDGTRLNVITHIPCGRALNVLASFLDSFSVKGGGKEVFWEIWSSLSPGSVVESKLVSSLALFESAWSGSDSKGAIGLDETACSVSEVLEGIAKSWLLQYSNALSKVDPLCRAKEIVVCGGVGNKSKFVIPVLEYLMPERKFSLISTQAGEETLEGLLKLAIAN
jgi:sugar (pentulose or hexulose) kinase